MIILPMVGKRYRRLSLKILEPSSTFNKFHKINKFDLPTTSAVNKSSFQLLCHRNFAFCFRSSICARRTMLDISSFAFVNCSSTPG